MLSNYSLQAGRKVQLKSFCSVYRKKLQLVAIDLTLQIPAVYIEDGLGI